MLWSMRARLSAGVGVWMCVCCESEMDTRLLRGVPQGRTNMQKIDGLFGSTRRTQISRIDAKTLAISQTQGRPSIHQSIDQQAPVPKNLGGAAAYRSMPSNRTRASLLERGGSGRRLEVQRRSNHIAQAALAICPCVHDGLSSCVCMQCALHCPPRHLTHRPPFTPFTKSERRESIGEASSIIMASSLIVIIDARLS